MASQRCRPLIRGDGPGAISPLSGEHIGLALWPEDGWPLPASAMTTSERRFRILSRIASVQFAALTNEMVYPCGMEGIKGWRRSRDRPTSWSDARRAGIIALVVLVVTAGLAVLVTVMSHQAWPPVVVATLGAIPGLYLAWRALPGGVDRPPRDRPVGQWNPIKLGVHQVIGGGPMPPYVRREHDEILSAVLQPRITSSRLVVIRGGSSTGKTRAAFEAVTSMLATWRLFYPLDAAALADRLDVGVKARTVLWLGDLRQYTSGDDSGAVVLGRLADLLEHQDHLIAVTTMWPEHWDSFTEMARAESAQQPRGTPGRLLARLPDLTGRNPAGIDPGQGGIISIPDVFSAAEVTSATVKGDLVLFQAAEAAARANQNGQLAQYLAGVPDLLNRYAGPGGNPYGQAVVTAAMDATRLGHIGLLPANLLLEASVGYLNAAHRTVDIDSWGDSALDWATRPLRGAVRALEPVPPSQGTGIIGYRVADYLDQYGRRTRQHEIGPAALWDALAAHASSPVDAARLGRAAQASGLSRYAKALWRWPSSSLLGSLDDTTRERLLWLGVIKEYQAGQMLSLEGDASKDVIALLDGTVKVVSKTGEGREVLLAIRAGGDLVGEESALDDRPRPSTVITMGVVTGCVIGQAAFLAALRDDQLLTQAVLRSTLNNLRYSDARRVNLARGYDATDRTARVLRDIALRYGVRSGNEIVISLPLTQPELASMVGVSEPAVHKVLRNMRDRRIIATGYRTITITDMAALEQLAGN